jgi:hypothetical protein
MKRVLACIIFMSIMSIVMNCYGADFNGDGTDDIGIFRPSSGLWSVRGITRVYFGSQGDIPVPGDYNDDASPEASMAVFRPNTGLWAIRDFTRLYFGSSQDIPVPGNYSGLSPARRMDIAVFRSSTGMWAVKDITRCYYGTYGDIPLRAVDFDGDGKDDIGVFRKSSGLWSVRGITRSYFGDPGDLPVPGDYHGDSSTKAAMAVFRPKTGMWAVKDLTRMYFGSSVDRPVLANYTGSSPTRNVDVTVFREATGLWAIKGGPRYYLGTAGDLPISNYNPVERTANIRYTVELSGECSGFYYKERGVLHQYPPIPESGFWSHSFNTSDGDEIFIKGYAGCYSPNPSFGTVTVRLYINGILVRTESGSDFDTEALISGNLRIDENGEAYLDTDFPPVAQIQYIAELSGGCEKISYLEDGEYTELEVGSGFWTDYGFWAAADDELYLKGVAGCSHIPTQGCVELKLYINNSLVKSSSDCGSLDAETFIGGYLRINENGDVSFEDRSPLDHAR